MRLISFGDYTFPGQAFGSTNAGDSVLRTVRLPGRDGGFDQLGTQPGYKEIGNYNTAFWLFADTPAQMQAKIDAVMALRNAGQKLLYGQPWGAGTATGDLRFTYAKVSNVNAPENVEELPHKQMRVEMSFQLTGAYWYSADLGEGIYYGLPESAYGGGFVYGGAFSAVTRADGDTWTVTAGGNVATYPEITLDASGTTADDMKLERLVGGVTEDFVTFTGSSTQTVVIDTMRRRVRVGALNKATYYSALDTQNYDWFRLEPGENTLKYTSSNAASIDVTVAYMGRWETT